MFNWYGDAEICFAYLSDVPGNGDVNQKLRDLAEGRWFKRGWTLQELYHCQTRVCLPNLVLALLLSKLVSLCFE